jgi:hypothetical protein
MKGTSRPLTVWNIPSILLAAMIGCRRAPLSLATTAILDADDQMAPRAFFLDEAALLRECVIQKGWTNFADGQFFPMASFLDGDGQMSTSPVSLATAAIMDVDDQMVPRAFFLDEEALLRECVLPGAGQILPAHKFFRWPNS